MAPRTNLGTPESCSQLLAAKQADPDADVSALEADIDQLVYSLYGLTRDEIAIIEESLQERTTGREVARDSATAASRAGHAIRAGAGGGEPEANRDF